MTETEKLRSKIQAVRIIMKQSLEKYPTLSISFNGGKDCTVLLDIFSKVFKNMYPNKKISAMYVKSANPFPEIQQFVKETISRYNLSLNSYNQPMKSALASFIKDTNTEAVLIGTRSTDPFSDHLITTMKSDNGWPEMMRVLPLLNWSYAEIWEYILEFDIPYCSLYEHGYTSLGGIDNTKPNKALKNNKKECGYDPAWELKDWELERDGRT